VFVYNSMLEILYLFKFDLKIQNLAAVIVALRSQLQPNHYCKADLDQPKKNTV
jgi:hypothetical protein